MKKFILAISVFLFSVPALAAETLYIQSARANILSGPAFNAKVIASAPKGSKVTAKFSHGSWYRIEYQGKQGWVSKLQVAKRQPLKKVSFFKKFSDMFKKDDARRRASRVTVVGAVRGLSADDRARAIGRGEDLVDYAALQRMNQISVDEDQVMSFLQQGLKGG